MRPPRWILAGACTLVGWQVLSLLALLAALATQPSAMARVASGQGRAAHCRLDRNCPAPLPSGTDTDPCRLVCMADSGALSWLGPVGLLPEDQPPSVDRRSGEPASEPHQAMSQFASPPITPPPETGA